MYVTWLIRGKQSLLLCPRCIGFTLTAFKFDGGAWLKVIKPLHVTLMSHVNLAMPTGIRLLLDTRTRDKPYTVQLYVHSSFTKFGK